MAYASRITLIVSASAISLGLAPLAQAQVSDASESAPAPAVADDASSSDAMGDIVVTARRKEEALQDVPISITALSTADIERKGLRSTEDLRNATPGLNISGLSRDKANFYIRGQQPGALTDGARNIPGVATYFAEVPADVAGPGTFFDLQNVQVLKGPQGTLFGRNTTGGAVLFEPHRPEFKTGGYIQAQYGSYNLRQVTGMFNVEIVPDVLALRVAGEIVRREGFTQSIITGQKQDDRNYESFRGTLLYQPTDRIENQLMVDYRNSHNNGSGLVSRVLVPTAAAGLASVDATRITTGPFAGLTIRQAFGAILPPGSFPAAAPGLLISLGGSNINQACITQVLAGCPAAVAGSTALGAFVAGLSGNGFYSIAPRTAWDAAIATQASIGPRFSQNYLLGLTKERTIGIVNRTKIELSDSLTLKNVISYRKTRNAEVRNYAGTPFPLLVITGPWQPSVNSDNFGTELFTEELQLQGKFEAANLNYIVGGYYEHQKPGFDQGTAGVTASSVGPVPSLRNFTYNDSSKAVFAHVEWSPVDIFTLSGGIRQNWDNRFTSIAIYTAAGACNQAIPGTVTLQCPQSKSAQFKATTYDVTASLKPSNGIMLYGSYRHGYKSGGLNVPVTPAPPPLPADAYAVYGPEFVNEIELGAKLDFNVGIPVRLNLAAFHSDYSSQQIAVSVTFIQPNGTAGFTSQIQNVAKSKIQGIEGQLSFQPAKGLTLGGFFSYLDAHPAANVVDARGTTVAFAARQLPNQPKWKYGLNGIYTYDLAGDAGAITASADFSWQDTYFSSLLPTLVDPNPAYGVVNARLSWERVLGSRFDVSVFASNLTNKTYALGGYPVAALGFDSAIYGEPRMFGVSLKFRFGDE